MYSLHVATEYTTPELVRSEEDGVKIINQGGKVTINNSREGMSKYIALSNH